MRYKKNTISDFWKRVTKTSSCWLWKGSLIGQGYGRFRFNGKYPLVHQLAYLWSGKKIPNGMQLDHLCRNRACVNPAHLEAVTIKENVLRGVGITAVNAKKRYCKKGHEFNEANTYIRPDGDRACKKCQKMLGKLYLERKVLGA